VVRPHHPWHPDDWFVDDPCGDEQTDPNFYGASLVRRIRACPVRQEIGCHSFSHPIFGDPGCSRETAESELAACSRIASAGGLALRSFAFPRNRVVTSTFCTDTVLFAFVDRSPTGMNVRGLRRR
jgi:hypothetical protein